jgi:hypothetical protein
MNERYAAAFSNAYTFCNIETDRPLAMNITTPATPSYSTALVGEEAVSILPIV